MRVCILAGLATSCFLLLGTLNCHAQDSTPLVTGDLSVYYGFDSVDEDGIFPDLSGNNLHGLITLGFEDANGDGLDDIRLDTSDPLRGAGAALFDTEPNINEDYIAVCDPTNQPDHNDGCGEFLDDRPAYVPKTGFTVAAWLKVEDTGTDQSIWQSRAGGGGFIHTQVQGGGGLRTRLRGDANTDNIVQSNLLPGEPVPREEWFHYAATYEKGPDEEGLGEYATYFNGEEYDGGEGNGNAAGFPDLDMLGDWAQGAWIGLVPDFNRQLVGQIDEFYLFTRAITPEEVQRLANPPTAVPGDIDMDGDCDADDIDALGAAIAAGNMSPNFDLNGDGTVDFGDTVFLVEDIKRSTWGDSNLDGEFNSQDLVEIFQAGEYEDATTGNSGWAEGDWNGDTEFNSSDLVLAFQHGAYEQGPQAPAAVPEPSSLALLLLGSLGLIMRKRNKR